MGAAPSGAGVARGAAISLLLLAAGLIACAVIGWTVTQQDDRRLTVEEHAALQSALAELRPVVGEIRYVDGSELRFIARRSGLHDLSFGVDLTESGGREIQSLTDAQGRIVGWFSWTPDRALVRALYWLWALAGAAGVSFLAGAVVAARALRRLARGLASSRETTRKREEEQADHGLLLRDLKSALAAQAFDVHYQPIVAAAGGAILGVEALLRWTHPIRGAIAPSDFVALAEQHGLMNELGDFVLRRALADGAGWPELFVSVNISPVQIRDPHFIERVTALLAQSSFPASRLVLEITEGILIDDPQEMQVKLEALRALGATIALDDFGTGYSSLAYLQKFPVHRLKIDRAFVVALGTVGNAGAIIHSIVTLGHALGMTVVAEGVETDQQRVLLRLAGCDEMQGFLFARPRPAAAIDAIVARSAADRASKAAAAAS